MNRLKYILTIMSTSFMLVILSNAFFISFQNTEEYASLSVMSIYQIFITCFLIAIAITYAESVSFLREHLAIVSYTIMMSLVFIMEFLFQRDFQLWNVIAEVLILTLVYAGVWFAIYCVHDHEAQKINQIIKKNRKGNIR